LPSCPTKKIRATTASGSGEPRSARAARQVIAASAMFPTVATAATTNQPGSRRPNDSATSCRRLSTAHVASASVTAPTTQRVTVELASRIMVPSAAFTRPPAAAPTRSR
jgi:hypothetical protein